MNANTLEHSPLVSIIMPVYNSGGYLLPCIRSILDQTYKNIELICIDDGSTDSSYDILAFQKSIDPRMKVIKQKNLGPSHARNAGLDMASGEYIAFVDSDDYIQYNAIEILVNNALSTQADIVVFGGNTFPKAVDTPQWIKEKLTSKDMLCDWSTAGTDVLLRENNTKPFIWLHFIRRELFETKPKIRFDGSFELGEDQIAIFQYFPRAKVVSFISDRLYNYRLNHSGSLMDKYSSLKMTKFETHIRLMGHILKYWNKCGYKDISGDCMSYFINFLIGDFDNLPEYKKVHYAQKILETIKSAGWNIFICKEWAYQNALKIVEYSKKDSIDMIEELNEMQKEIDRINEEFNDTLNSKAYKIGRLLTPKSKRLSESDLSEDSKKIF